MDRNIFDITRDATNKGHVGDKVGHGRESYLNQQEVVCHLAKSCKTCMGVILLHALTCDPFYLGKHKRKR